MRTMSAAIAAVLILVSCGRTETSDPTAEPKEPETICSPAGGTIQSDSVCLDQRLCSKKGEETWFLRHMCFCWDTLCICFRGESTAPCSIPEDPACGYRNSMAITGPDACKLPADELDSLLSSLAPGTEGAR